MWLKKGFYVLMVFFCMTVALPTIAQKKITHQKMVWLRYSGKYQLSKDWSANLEIEDRRFAFPDRQQNWVLPRVTINRSVSDNWSAGAGFVYYLNNSPAVPEEPTAISVPELRPFQDLSYKQSIKKLSIDHRYRLEERFIHKDDGKDLQPGYNFNFRVRYRLQIQYPIPYPKGLKLVVADEVFLNFGSKIIRNTFDQNRIYAGLNYPLSKHVQVEADYINQFQEKSNGDNYIRRDILRVTLYHALLFH